MTEDVGHDGGDPQLWQLVNDKLQGPAPYSLVADRLVNVDTDLGRVFVGGTAIEWFEGKPANDLVSLGNYPQRMGGRK